jgi:osmotically-inducible protein OsmY
MVALHRSWFDPKTMNVSVQGGNVRLTATVREWNERDVAGSTAWAAPGTTSVENDISPLTQVKRRRPRRQRRNPDG